VTAALFFDEVRKQVVRARIVNLSKLGMFLKIV